MRVFTEPAGDLSAGDVWWQIKADSNDVRLVAETRNREHAARLAACWNACEGIPTDMLKPGLVREMTETMDILLHIIDQFDRNHVFRRMFATSLEGAGEYVAKLRGEASSTATNHDEEYEEWLRRAEEERYYNEYGREA